MGNKDLSNALGWVSIACWIVVYSPQILENYQLKSGEGLSVAFVMIWLLGDLCNLVGAMMAHLQTTMIILAAYYTLCDITLMYQIYYYRYTRQARPIVPVPVLAVVNEAGEQTPLLNPNGGSTSKPGAKTLSGFNAALRYLLCLLFVVLAGMTAWSISSHYSAGQDPDGPAKGPVEVVEWKSQVIGWMSAVLYLGSRIPQIVKNTKTHCEGLSLALFMFCVAGNVTYVSSICTLSMEREHLIANASWLAGSGLTVFLDFIVLFQFFYYRSTDPPVVVVGNDA